MNSNASRAPQRDWNIFSNFSCCYVEDQEDVHQISYASDPKLEESAFRPNGTHAQRPAASNCVGIPASARSQGSAPSTARSFTAEEKRKEKDRLQDMVKDFAKSAMLGMPCQWLHPNGTGGPQPATYSIDRSMNVFSVRPEGEQEVTCQMADVLEVLRQSEQTPFSLGQLTLTQPFREGTQGNDLESRFICVQYEVKGRIQQVGILLPDSYERERFFTCMKILRWAMDTRRERMPAK